MFTSANDCIDSILKDFEKAKQKVLISLPDSKLISDNADLIWDAIVAAKKRGIYIEIKAKEVISLPKDWKTQTCISDKAIFPMIMIDDSIIWYSYPISSGFFADGNAGGYATVMPAIARIKGEHTIELIKSLSEIK